MGCPVGAVGVAAVTTGVAEEPPQGSPVDQGSVMVSMAGRQVLHKLVEPRGPRQKFVEKAKFMLIV